TPSGPMMGIAPTRLQDACALNPSYGLFRPTLARASDPEQILEGLRCLGDRLVVGALLGFVLRRGETMRGAAIDVELERRLGGAQLLDHFIDDRQRIARVLGAVLD